MEVSGIGSLRGEDGRLEGRGYDWKGRGDWCFSGVAHDCVCEKRRKMCRQGRAEDVVTVLKL